MAVCVLNRVWLFLTPWTVAYQAPLSIEFSRQEYCNGLPFPLPGDLSDPGIKPASPMSPALAGRFFTTEPPGKPISNRYLLTDCPLFHTHTPMKSKALGCPFLGAQAPHQATGWVETICRVSDWKDLPSLFSICLFAIQRGRGKLFLILILRTASTFISKKNSFLCWEGMLDWLGYDSVRFDKVSEG